MTSVISLSFEYPSSASKHINRIEFILSWEKKVKLDVPVPSNTFVWFPYLASRANTRHPLKKRDLIRHTNFINNSDEKG